MSDLITQSFGQESTSLGLHVGLYGSRSCKIVEGLLAVVCGVVRCMRARDVGVEACCSCLCWAFHTLVTVDVSIC
jgi:hypothetical protein